MKKKITLYISVALFLSFCYSCHKIDNYDAPSASIHGNIVDGQGEPVQSDISNLGVKITYIEHGNFDSPEKQSMGLTADGKYRNNLMFPGTYDLFINNANFPDIDTVENFVVKKGDNELDFTVNPYIKITTSSISQEGTSIIAKFTLKTLNDSMKVDQVQLFAHVDPVVSFGSKIANSSAISLKRAVASTEEFTLQMDLSKQSNKFTKYPTGTPFWFRVGAIVDKSDASTGSTPKWNYAAPVKLSLDL